MCGICGTYGGEDPVREEDLRRMTDLMAYRGPDKDGFYVQGNVGLGYRRLSIIDLVTGDQPIANEDHTVWVVFNGEIYNHLDLRNDLERLGHHFRTRADTEVLVHGYEAWGLEFLQRLNGMFALALWDGKARRLLLARDRLGVKPLYYRWEGGQIAFASEIKCLLLQCAVRLEPEALVDYLSFFNCFGSKTFFHGIRKLLPGQYLLIEDGEFRAGTYWELAPVPSTTDEGIAVQQYLTLLDDSVRLELMSDVPLGAQVSGGMDSSAVVVAARKHLDSFDTFSASFPDSDMDETPYAERVAELVGARHHKVAVRASDVPRILPRILYHLDEPRAGPGVIPQWVVNELASKHVRVVLTGHGGDELFAGYPSYLAAYIRDTVRGGNGRKVLECARDLIPRLRTEGARRILGLPLYSLASEDLARYGRIAAFSPKDIVRILKPQFSGATQAYDPRSWLDRCLRSCRALGALDRLLYLDVKTYLPTLLDNEDRTSMAFSLEARVPMLDHRMAEFASTLCPELKVRGLTLKHLPRRALSTRLPRDIVEHRKMGFPVPLSEWLRGDLAGWVEDILAEDRVGATGLLQPELVRGLVSRHVSGKADNSERLWALVNLELFFRGTMIGGGS